MNQHLNSLNGGEKSGLALKSNYIHINKNQQKWQKQNQPQ